MAKGSVGEAFVTSFAKLTSADVAASTDITGAVALGGNWVLEKQTGIIEAGLFASQVVLDSYQGDLATMTVTLATASDTGKLGDNLTKNTTPSVTFTPTTAHSYYTVSWDSGAAVSTTSAVTTVQTVTASALSAGAHTVDIKTYSGTIGSGTLVDSGTYNFNVDTTLPTLAAFYPAASSTAVVFRNTNIILQFSEEIQAGGGTVTLQKNATNTLLMTLTAGATSGAFTTGTGLTAGTWYISGKTLILDPAAGTTLSKNTSYNLDISPTALTDVSGNAYAGITSTDTTNIYFKTVNISNTTTGSSDTTAPTTTVSTLLISADVGTSTTDFKTNTAVQTISGQLSANLAAGELVKVSVDNGTTWAVADATVGSKGYSLSGVTLSALTAGNTLKVWVEDAAGNAATSKTQGYTIDTTAPTVTSVVATGSTITNGSGTLDNGNSVTLTLTASENVTITGGTPTLTLSDGGTATYTGGSGTTALTFVHTVASGQNTPDLTVTAFNANGASLIDTAGNAINATGAVTNPSGILVVAAVPLTANITAVTPDPRNTDAGTVNILFNRSVTGVDASDFTLTRGGSSVDIGGVSVTGSGAAYAINLTNYTLTDGAYTLSLKGDGSTGITSTSGSSTLSAGATESFIVDMTPPTAVVNAILTISNDDLSPDGDFITRVPGQTVTGTFTGSLLAGEKFQISADGGTTWVNTDTGAGTWSATGITLLSGTGALTSRTIDLAGNALAGASQAYTLQIPAPYSIVRQNPTFSTTNADVVNFRVTFTTPVQGVIGTDFSLTPGSLDGATVQVVTPVLNSNGTQYDVQVGGLAGRTAR